MLNPDLSPSALAIDSAWHPLASGLPPVWASAWGQDEYGVFTEFTYNGVTQRLRWIPPGRFLMGSPDNEPGRFDDEGPQHPVVISNGFWLFATPCTQALWQAVMGDNPSYFQSPQRPVETVSWDDVQIFIQRLNTELPGLQLSLPSEAQWEHACRAGTASALYSGAIELLGKNNAPALDPIAWYGGNSGVAFDLADGFDSTDWPEMQYPNPKSGTREVARKQPNAWGLYDMLGNVWEWCADDRRDYSAEAQLDPLGSLELGGSRVVRGGSWYFLARYCRCAYRHHFDPGSRLSSLGFRCARVQA